MKPRSLLIAVVTVAAISAGAPVTGGAAPPVTTRLSFGLPTKLAKGQTVKLRVVALKPDVLAIRNSRNRRVVRSRIQPGRATEIGITRLVTGITGRVTLTVTSASGRAPAINRRSGRPRIIVSRVPVAADTTNPTSPPGLNASETTRTRLTVTWAAATDNVGVTSYLISRNGSLVATTVDQSQTVDQLDCGTDYSIGVKARDSAGNVGPETTATFPTVACPVVMSVGDMACPPVVTAPPTCQQAAVAAVVNAQNPDAFIGLGDAQYPDWSAVVPGADYNAAFGSLLPRTWAVQGNHDFNSGAGAPGLGGSGTNWYTYFGAAHAGPAYGQPWSVDLGTWHVVLLNSNCDSVTNAVAGCAAQNTWLDNDLRTTRQPCVVAAWHHPRWSPTASDGPSYVDNPLSAPWFQTLYTRGADVVLNGHSHHYERLHPVDPSRNRDDARGVRNFTIGTGGRNLRAPNALSPVSAATLGAYGALKLTLRARSVEWVFITEAGASFDAGSADCHSKA